jgi:hypothetical protein
MRIHQKRLDKGVGMKQALDDGKTDERILAFMRFPKGLQWMSNNLYASHDHLLRSLNNDDSLPPPSPLDWLLSSSVSDDDEEEEGEEEEEEDISL